MLRLPSDVSIRTSLPAVPTRRSHADMVGQDRDGDDGDNERGYGDGEMSDPLGDERSAVSRPHDEDEPPSSRRRVAVEHAMTDILTPKSTTTGSNVL